MGTVESYVASIIDAMKKSGQIRVTNEATISDTNIQFLSDTEEPRSPLVSRKRGFRNTSSGNISDTKELTISVTNDISGRVISVTNEGVGRGGGVVRVEEVRRSLSEILHSVGFIETRVRIYRNTRRVDGKTYEWRVARASFSPAGLDIRDGDTVYILTAEELRRLIFMIAEYVAEKCIGEEY